MSTQPHGIRTTLSALYPVIVAFITLTVALMRTMAVTGPGESIASPAKDALPRSPSNHANQEKAPSASRLPTVGKPAPAFTLTDAGGKKQSLAALKGRPVALFFFCGCSWCYDVAQEWATLQRADALRPEPIPGKDSAPAPWTVLIYQGSAEEVRSLVNQVGLDKGQTLLLPDPDNRVTSQIYKADPCPRVFVLDDKGIVCYVNRGPDDKPREAAAALIVAKTLTALRGLSASTQPIP